MSKKFISLILLASVLLCSSCHSGGKSKDTEIGYGKMGNDINDGVSFEVGGYGYQLYPTEFGFSFKTVKSGSDDAIFFSDKPVKVMFKKLGASSEKKYEVGYSEIKADGSKIIASAVIETVYETVLSVTDTYSAVNDMLDINRVISIQTAGKNDEGFASAFSFEYAGGKDLGIDGMDYFVPGVWNKNTELDHNVGLVSSYDSENIYIKDTRTGLPMITGRVSSTGDTLSVGRLNPVISSDVSESEVPAWYTDENYLCGSLGVSTDKGKNPALTYTYPSSEEPWVYLSSVRQMKRFHPVRAGFTSSYCVSLRSDSTSDYNDAMMKSYISYFSRTDIDYYDCDLEAAYQEVMKTMMEYYREKITPNMTICGLPYGCFVTDGHVESDMTMEMGFVGMEITAAYQFMRYGYLYGDTKYIERGEKMADMWADYSRTDSGVLKVYLYSTGNFNLIPSYLRRMTDGMEGMLDCLRLADANGMNKDNWKSIVTEYADFLVDKQNSDGSWYRAYDFGGNVFNADASSKEYRQYEDIKGVDAEYKGCTTIPLRFLVRMYEYTGNKKYLDAAKKGAEYVMSELIPMGKFAGATCDGLVRTDKETGIFSMYGMNALYSVTGEEKYLEAAKQAAVYAASWMMTYDYKIADDRNNPSGKYFTENASLTGQSLITSGHSTVDGFMAYTYYEYFKLYLWTGDTFYYDFARFAERNSKRNLNFDGHMGYSSKGLCLEAINVADFFFITSGNTADSTGVWLPWCSTAHIEPISEMKDIFGVNSVEEAEKLGKDKLLELVADHGAGGKVGK